MDTMRIGVLNICSKCGQAAEHLESQCRNELHCVNCGEKHSADSKECQIWHKEILRLKFTRNISFIEARKLVEAPTPIPGISYANITQSSIKLIRLLLSTLQSNQKQQVQTTKQKNYKNKNSKVIPPKKVKQKHLSGRNKQRLA